MFHLVIPIFHYQIFCWGKYAGEKDKNSNRCLCFGVLQNSLVKITLSVKEIIPSKYHMPTSPHLQKSPAFRNDLRSPLELLPLNNSVGHLNRSCLLFLLGSESFSPESPETSSDLSSGLYRHSPPIPPASWTHIHTFACM